MRIENRPLQLYKADLLYSDCVFSHFLPLILVPESSNGLQFSEYRPHTEIPVLEVEKYRYRHTGFEFGPVPITSFYHKMRYFSVNWKRATPDFWGVSPRDPLDPRGQKNTFFSFFEIFTVQRARKNHGLLGLRRRNPNPGNLIQTFQLRLGRWAMSRGDARACARSR